MRLAHAKPAGPTSLKRNAKERRRQVYLDYLQSAIGLIIAAAYRVRSRAGAPVSTPLAWEEVRPGLLSSSLLIRNIRERLKEKGDLFKGVLGKGTGPSAECLERLRRRACFGDFSIFL